MTPQRVLDAWRDRWGKPDTARVPLRRMVGPVGQWVERACTAPWAAHPSVWAVALALWLIAAALITPLRFAPLEQVFLATLWLLAGLMISRLGAGVAVLLLSGLLGWAVLRYLHWRWADSLSPLHGLELGWMWLLVALESGAVLAWLLQHVQRAWPLAHPSLALPESVHDWPMLSFYILAHDRNSAQVQATLQAVLACQWPRSKLALLVLDDQDRAEVRSAANAGHAWYASDPAARGQLARQINQALGEFDWPVLVLLEAGQQPNTAWLHAAMGSLLAQPQHALVSSPAHPWLGAAPLPDPAPALRPAVQALILRREVLLRAGGLPSAEAGVAAPLLAQIEALDQQSLVLGLDANDRFMVIPGPLNTGHLRVRAVLARATAPLGLLWPLWLVLLAAVAPVFVLTGWRPMQASPLDALSHALLLWGLGVLWAQRLGQAGPRAWSALWHQWPLKLYVTLLTPLTCTATLLQAVWRRGLPRVWADWQPRGWADWAWTGAFASQVWTLAWCVRELSLGGHVPQLEWVWASAASAGALLWMMGLRLALRQEIFSVTRHLQALAQRDAMIRLPSGRTTQAHTLNFPQRPLHVRCARLREIDTDAPVSITLMHDTLDLHLLARPLARDGQTLQLDVAADDLAEYQAFVQAVMARGPRWPLWLPWSLNFLSRLRAPGWLRAPARWAAAWRTPWAAASQRWQAWRNRLFSRLGNLV